MTAWTDYDKEMISAAMKSTVRRVWVFALGGEVYCDAHTIKTRMSTIFFFILFSLSMAVCGVAMLWMGYGRGYLIGGLASSIGGSWFMVLLVVRLWQRPWGQKRDYFLYMN